MIMINSKVFGELSYDVYWQRDYSIDFLKKERKVILAIDGDNDMDFEESQYRAFEELEANKDAIVKKVEDQLFKHYLSECDENRAKFGSDASCLSPVIYEKENLEDLVNLKQVIIMESFDENSREIGFVFDAKWNPELGVGVKVVNGEVELVGTQDIVL